jgi:outer membrane protein TolC
MDLTAVFLAGMLVGGQSSPSPPVLTLGEAVSKALAASQLTLSAAEDVHRAELQLGVARSAFAPKFVPTAFGSFGTTDVANQSYGLAFSQRLPFGTEVKGNAGATTAQNQLGRYYSTDSTFLITQPLIRGFGTSMSSADVYGARARLEMAEGRRTAVERQVAIQVATSYYRIVTSSHLGEESRRSVDRARTLLDASKAKLQIGRVSQLDVFRAEQLLAEAEGQALDAAGAIEDSRDELRVMLNLSPDFAFAVQAGLPAIPATVDESVLTALALKQRPELAGARTALQQAELSQRVAANRLLPQVDLNVGLTRREIADTLSSSFGLNRFKFVTFAGVSYPLNRTEESAAQENAAIEIIRQRRELEMLERAITQEARRALRAQERLRRQVMLAERAVDAATREVELSEVRFQHGLSNNLDVVTAESHLLNARARHFGMRAELAISALQLSAATGTLDPRTDVR